MPVRLIVTGPDGCGKSAMLVRYLSKRFIETYQSGCDIMYRHELVIQENVIQVDILDTSACERRGFSGLSACLSWADSFLFVYDVTLLDSAPRCRLFLDLLRSVRGHAGDRAPVVLVGNKTDLAYCGHGDKADMEILSSQFRCRHFVTSAVDDPKVIDLIFTGLIAEGHLANQSSGGVGGVGGAGGGGSGGGRKGSLGRPHQQQQQTLSLLRPVLEQQKVARMKFLKDEEVTALEPRSAQAGRRKEAPTATATATVVVSDA